MEEKRPLESRAGRLWAQQPPKTQPPEQQAGTGRLLLRDEPLVHPKGGVIEEEVGVRASRWQADF